MQHSSVGIRELRQNLSVYVRRVRDGEIFEVTEHGRPVARLTPLLERASSPLQRLIDAGIVRAPRQLLQLSMPPGPISTRGSDALAREREDRL